MSLSEFAEIYTTPTKFMCSEEPINCVDGIDEAPFGNTSSKGARKKQISQRMHWFFTFNNYLNSDIDGLDALFKEICTDWVFQEEVGDSGTPHLQGVIKLKKPMRFTEFTPNLTIHWEPVKRLQESITYCTKERSHTGRRCEGGNWKFKRPLKLITPDRPWQVDLLNILKEEPDDRKVYWYWSDAGNMGKSSFGKYLVATHSCVFIDEGKKTDIMKTIMDADMDRPRVAVVFDVPRDNGNKVSYKSIESIKNGMIYSPKYESGYKLFNPPHLIVFCNYEPDYTKLSADRWVVINIDD